MYDDKHRKRITFNLPVQLIENLKKTAKVFDNTPSEMLEEILTNSVGDLHLRKEASERNKK